MEASFLAQVGHAHACTTHGPSEQCWWHIPQYSNKISTPLYNALLKTREFRYRPKAQDWSKPNFQGTWYKEYGDPLSIWWVITYVAILGDTEDLLKSHPTYCFGPSGEHMKSPHCPRSEFLVEGFMDN